MLRNFSVISIVFCASQLLTIVQQCTGDNSLTCKHNKGTISISNDEGTCQCSVQSTYLPNGYERIKGFGAYKFHTVAEFWYEAEKICMKEGAHLAILNSEAEAKALQKLFQAKYKKITGSGTGDLAWLGVHDQFEEGEWVTVLGDSLASTGYVGWNNDKKIWGIQPDNTNDQDCAALIRATGMMDDVQCSDVGKLAFFCEMPNTCL